MSLKHRLASFLAILLALIAVGCTLPLLPLVWLWAVIVQGEEF